jgi:hypothetical protein
MNSVSEITDSEIVLYGLYRIWLSISLLYKPRTGLPRAEAKWINDVSSDITSQNH